MIVVCDTSPIIALAVLDQLHLLDMLFEKVLIPKQVYKELTVSNKQEARKIAVWEQGKVEEAKDKQLMQIFNMMLDPGESEAIALYWEKEGDYFLIYEKKGRKIALHNDIKIIGTLGILLLSKQKGFLLSLKSLLDKLQQSNIRVSYELYKKIVVLAGES